MRSNIMHPQTVPQKSKKVLDLLDSHGLAFELHHHAPVFTVAEAQSLRGQIGGGHSKNLFLKDRKDNVFLLSAMEDAPIDLKRLYARIGAKSRLSFGSPALLDEILGVEPGAVSPLGAVNDIHKRCSIILDKTFFEFDAMNFHPLDNRMTISIAPADLVKFLEIAGHTPQILDLTAGIA